MSLAEYSRSEANRLRQELDDWRRYAFRLEARYVKRGAAGVTNAPVSDAGRGKRDSADLLSERPNPYAASSRQMPERTESRSHPATQEPSVNPYAPMGIAPRLPRNL